MADLQKIVDQLSELSVLEAAELSKMLEEKWGVSAAAPVAVAAVAAGPVAEEQTEFNVVLVDAGGNKVAVIKEIRAVTTLGLKEANDASENTPYVIKEAVSKDEAEKLKKQFEAAGAKVEVK